MAAVDESLRSSQEDDVGNSFGVAHAKVMLTPKLNTTVEQGNIVDCVERLWTPTMTLRVSLSLYLLYLSEMLYQSDCVRYPVGYKIDAFRRVR